MGPQSCGSPRTKCHLDVGLVEIHIVYYKGGGGGLLPSPNRGESCESKFACGEFCESEFAHVLAPKVFKLCTNQLVI
jgi:hypothetical protein